MDFDPLDITPSGENGPDMIDPYELFSTPPNQLVLSSTPTKQADGGRKGRGSARKALLSRKAAANSANIRSGRGSLSFDMGKDATRITKNSKANSSIMTSSTSINKNTTTTTSANTTKTSRAIRTRNLNKNADSTTTKTTTKRGPIKKQKSQNLWDQCLEKNPELAEFVDKFNESLAEACSKPLDIVDEN